jgi:hypothetical protein
VNPCGLESSPVTVPLTNGDTAAIFFDYVSAESFLVQIY